MNWVIGSTQQPTLNGGAIPRRRHMAFFLLYPASAAVAVMQPTGDEC